jgi:uncharacterized membrane protein
MGWRERHRILLYVRNSIWLFPALSIVAGLASVALLTRVDRAFGWEMNIDLDTARAIMGTIAGSMFSLLVLVCSAVLVAVQLASAQLTPRIVTLVYRNPYRKFALSLFAFTFTFSVGLLVRLESSVPLLTGYLAAYGFLLNLAFFLLFVDGMGKTLRPSTALQTVALLGREGVTAVYPRRLGEPRATPPGPVAGLEGEPWRVVLNEAGGAVLAFDLKGLVSLAERADCLVELVPQVGDFVAAGDPLFRVYGGGEGPAEDDLRGSVALGPERTLEQDPTFAFRIMVDIACRALSPAVNDPTTAVLAVDQIHHLLRHVGGRDLAEGREADAAGRLRFVYRMPCWGDFVRLAVTEIRQYGRDSIQVVRRLRAMLENLIETLPDRRAPVLRRELGLLDDSARRTFPDAADQTLAKTGDLQGLGGRQRQATRAGGADARPYLSGSAA